MLVAGEIRRQALEEMLRGEWRNTAIETCRDLLRHLEDDDLFLDPTRMEKDEIEKDYSFLGVLMKRRESLSHGIKIHRGAQRGPGTPGHIDLYGRRKP